MKNFKSLASDTWYRRLVSRLSLTDLATCERFIQEREGLSTDEYCSQVLRWGVDVKIESKNYPIMNELLLVSGTMENKKK